MSRTPVVVIVVLVAAVSAGFMLHKRQRDADLKTRAVPRSCATFEACIAEADAAAEAKAPARRPAAAILLLYERAATFASTADEIRSARGGAIVLALEATDCARARRHIDALRTARPSSQWLQAQYAHWRKSCRPLDDVLPLVVHERSVPVATGVIDERTVAVISDEQLQIGSVPEQRVLARLPRAVGCLAISTDARWLATGCGSRSISVFAWNGAALALSATSQPFPISEALRDANYSGVHRFDDEWGRHGVIERLEFRPDGSLLAVSDGWASPNEVVWPREEFRFQATLTPPSWRASAPSQVPAGAALEPQGPLSARRGGVTATVKDAALVVSDDATGLRVTLVPARMALDTVVATISGAALTREQRSVRRFDVLSGTLEWSYEQDSEIAEVVPLDPGGRRALVYGPKEATILDLEDGSYTCDWATERKIGSPSQLVDMTSKYVLETVVDESYVTSVEDCTSIKIPRESSHSLVERPSGTTYAGSMTCQPPQDRKKCWLRFRALDGGEPLPTLELEGVDDIDHFDATMFVDDDTLLVQHQSSCNGSGCIDVQIKHLLFDVTANGWSAGRKVEAAVSRCGRAVWLAESQSRFVRILEGRGRGGPFTAVGEPFSIDADGTVRFTANDDSSQTGYDFFTGKIVNVAPETVDESFFARYDEDIGFRSPFTLRTRGITAELFSRSDNEYAIVSGGGEYLATPGFRDLIRFTDGQRNYPAEDHDLRFNRPDLVLAALGASTELVDAYRARVAARREVLGAPGADATVFVELTAVPPGIVSERKLSLTYRAVALEGVVARSLVYVNGHLARTVENSHKKRSAAWESWLMDVDTTVALSAGLNKIQVYALDGAGRRSASASTYVLNAKPPAKPALHVLVVGISAYSASAWQLQYGKTDAERVSAAITEAVGAATRIRLGQVRTLVDEQATKPGIVAEIGRMTKSADLDDLMIVYLAGHGFARGASGYTFATHDFDFDRRAGGLSIEALDDALRSTGVRHRLVLIDACEAGSTLDWNRGPVSRTATVVAGLTRGLRMRAPPAEVHEELELVRLLDWRRGLGSTFFVASSAGQPSQEAAAWGGGVFAKALGEGFGGRADLDEDGSIVDEELFEFVTERVREDTDDAQLPTLRLRNLDDPIRIPLREPRAR